jgi:hypothetical protein
MKGQDNLSIHRSFIVRLYPDFDLETRDISGYVEHIVSGEAGEFHSVEELLRFMGHLLYLEDRNSEPLREH